MAEQGVITSEQCPTGGKEAEEIFQLGRKFQRGAKGYLRDFAKAEKLYEEPIKMGNAKAALCTWPHVSLHSKAVFKLNKGDYS